MAITTVGFDGSVDELQWARLHEIADQVGYKHGVFAGLILSPATGTRLGSVSAGVAWVVGVLAESDAAVSLAFDANTGTANRVDYVVLEVNWAANTATVKVVKGASATAPRLTQNAGVLWQLPIARVTVRPGASSILATDIEGARPLPRVTQFFSGTVDTTLTVGREASPKLIDSVTVHDPGYPYRVRATAGSGFSSANSGYGRLISEVVNGGTTTRLEAGQSGALAAGGASAQLVGRPSGVLTGTSVVNLLFVAVQVGVGDGPLGLGDAAALPHFSVERIPA